MLTYQYGSRRISDVARRKTGQRGGYRPGAGRKPEFRDRVLRSVSFERDELARLDAVAKHRGVTVSVLIRSAIRSYIRRRGAKR